MVNLPLEILEQACHDQIVPPDEHVAEVVPVGFHSVKETTLGQQVGIRSINRLDLLHRHGAPGNIHGASLPVFIVLPLSHQLSPYL